ncbi:MAG: T9SS type A sorting domain-containing protein, partial [Bacteroidales bacterium]|nr:T9SS type A sorting domain-containing protein [Bacteroidales bacterium]
ATIPATTTTDGWIGVQAAAGTATNYWCNTMTGTGSAVQALGGTYTVIAEKLAVCLSQVGGGGGASDWLTLGQYEGSVGPNGTSFNLPVNFDATGTAAGEVYNAQIVVSTQPNVGTFTIPVTMTIYGDPLSPVTDLTATITNEVTGSVALAWTFTRPANFQYFLIKRNGLGIGTTTNNSFNDLLPAYNSYCYTVTPVYDAGNGVPGGPACVDWLIPVLCYSPANPTNSQWPLVNEQVMLTLENCGQGTLEFSFPDYAAQVLLNDPNIQKNDVSPVEGFDRIAEPAKGENDPRDGGGHPVVLGAGGPDTFGYEWIDSDEPGGPVFNWVEISGIGTNHPLVGDDNNVSITLPFAFPFYGVDKTSLLAGTNGYLTFGTSGNSYSNTGIPNAAQPNDMIAAFWDDMSFVGGTSFLYSYNDVANSRFIIQYTNVPRLGASFYNTFQFILTPNGGITIQYLNVNGTLNSATVGIENAAGNDGLQVAFNAAYIANSKAIYFFQPAHFITSVTPYYGTISEGNSVDVTMVYSSEDYGVGVYNEDLFISTNEQGSNEWFIPNTMVVYQPATISGMVTDCVTGAPKKNVTVTAVGASTYTAESAENGTYSMVVDPGTYDVSFTMVGFHTFVVEDVVVTVAGSPVDVDAAMCEMAYPVSFVNADPNEADTQALITWGIPMGPYSIQYDDGSAENYFSWLSAGSASAVKFTPAGYPATILGGRMYVGDGSFPEGVDFLGAEFAVGVIAADGTNGLPGTVLDSTIVTVDNFGWVNFDNAFHATVNSGNFYIAVWKLFTQVPVGVDQNVPTYYRSYVKPVGGNWAASSYQDFMIRAIVSGPGTNVAERTSGVTIYPAKPTMTDFVATCAPNGTPGLEKTGLYVIEPNQEASRELVDYAVERITGFDPEAGETPEDGDMTIIAAHNATQSFNDANFGAQPAGFYAYGVRANYSVENSTWVYSNVVAHGLDNVVTLNVSRCDGGDVAGAEVHLLGHNYPYQHLMATTDASGVVVFDSVINGIYDLSAFKLAFQPYVHNGILINYDYTEDVVLANKTYPAKNLVVDPATSVATWEAPNYTAVEMQGFEDAAFPPAGWAKESNSRGFFRTDNGSSSFWQIPAGDGFYACANDDGFNGDASEDRLITPVCDLREGQEYSFTFDYFYDGSWGGSAYVEYSLDNGASWTELMSLGAVGSWTTESISLASFAGEDAITFCFHYDDNGMWADGIAVDNVMVSNGPVDILGYEVSLNGGYITEVGPEVLTYQYRNLTYGQTYTAQVKAKFPCGLSEPATYVFQSNFLYPPRELGDAYVYNTNEIPLMWFPPMTVAGPARSSVGIVENGPVVSAGVTSKGAIPAELLQHADSRPTQYLNPLDSYNAWIAGPNGGTPSTLYVADMGAYTYTVVGNSLVDPSTGDFMNNEDTYMLCAGDWGSTFYSVDVTTGEATFIAPFTGGFDDVSGMACDRTTNTMYVCMTNISASQIGTLDIETGAITLIGSSTTETPGLIQIAIDGSGQMYGWDIVNDASYLIDKETGAVTELGSLGFDANYGQGGNWSAEDNTIYLTAFNNSTFQGELRALDVATGGTTFLGVLPQLQCTAFGVPASAGPIDGGVPAGLISFNLYQDGELLTNVPYADQATDEYVNYVINPIDPGTYSYDVSAVYDLSVFGLTGTAESAWEGTDVVTVAWGFPLPFNEDFGQGSFDFNHWRFDDNGANWVINSQSGNGAPSAEFTWDPLLTDGYSSTMTSNPLLGDQITEGNIWLDFDLKLQDRNATGAEKMKVEVFNGSTWSQVALFSNEGSFDYTASHVNITAAAKGRVFQVRFNAIGDNSFDVISWFVDNINIYRTCTPPTSLTGEYVYNNGSDFGAEVCWNGPAGTNVSEWLYYDDGVNVDGIGGPASFSWAVKFDPSQLEDFEGASLTKIKIVARTAAANELRIYEGTNAATLLHTQTLSGLPIEEWSEVELTSSVAIDITKQLWITVYTDDGANYPAGCGNGMNEPNGDLITLDGSTWEHLSDYALDYTWNLRGFVTTATGATASIPMEAPKDNYNNDSRATLAISGHGSTAAALVETAERAISGYNVYRKQVEVDNDYVLLTNVPAVQGTTHYCYYDETGIGEYYYQVTAAYSSETDACESAPGMALVNTTEDFVYVLVTDVASNEANVTRMYPNPANESVTIESSKMNRIIVMNTVGQVVYDVMANGANKVSLNTVNYEAGVYVVRIEAAEGTVTRRVTVVR